MKEKKMKNCAVFMDYSDGTLAVVQTRGDVGLTRKQAIAEAKAAIKGKRDIGTSRVTYVRVFEGSERIAAMLRDTKRKDGR